MSDSLRDSPGKNTGVGSHPLIQRIFLTQGSNSGLLYSMWILYHLSHKGSPGVLNQHRECIRIDALALKFWNHNLLTPLSWTNSLIIFIFLFMYNLSLTVRFLSLITSFELLFKVSCSLFESFFNTHNFGQRTDCGSERGSLFH